MKDYDSCADLGYVYKQTGDEVLKLKYYELSCENNSAKGCKSLGYHYKDKDEQKSKLYLDKACKFDNWYCP